LVSGPGIGNREAQDRVDKEKVEVEAKVKWKNVGGVRLEDRGQSAFKKVQV
jgi:hypothetical protein